MTTMPDNPIPALMVQYRKLKAQSDAIDAKMKAVKAQIRPAVEATLDEKWQDKDGYARMVTRKPSVSFDTKAVNNFAETWAESKDAIMQSCGEMLLQLREEKDGFTYLQVK